jgi:glycosyltransferase involved in cell wall biosynthesis
MRVDFILSKDPATEHGGDVAMTKLVMDLARQSFDVRGFALSPDPGRSGDGIIRTRKPPVNSLALVGTSLGGQKSLIHCRFNTVGLAKLISDSAADVFVAEHSYMAESYLSVRSHDAGQRLLVNAHVSEAEVWQLTKPKLVRWEHKRIKADENRVAGRAKSVAYFDREEARKSSSSKSYWLNLTLPPQEFVDRSVTPKRLVFLGDRTWPPNADAAKKAVRLWPTIAAGISGAELLLVGKPEKGARPGSLPSGVKDLSFVHNLSDLLSTARALIAPVSAGGGVRVKILEAARIGLPVVGTRQALGSLAVVLPIEEYEDDVQFIQAAREYLMNPRRAGIHGSKLYEANAARWSQKIPHGIVHDWLVGK